MEIAIVSALSVVVGVILGWRLRRDATIQKIDLLAEKVAVVQAEQLVSSVLARGMDAKIVIHDETIKDHHEAIHVIDEFLKNKMRQQDAAVRSLSSEVRQSLGLSQPPDDDQPDDAIRASTHTEQL